MRLLLLILMMVFTGPCDVFAQEKESHVYQIPGSTFHNEGADRIRSLQRRSLANNGFIKPKQIEVSLVQYDYMDPEDQFGLLMVVPDVVSGCWDITPLEYESSFIEPYYFDVKVKHYQRKKIEVANVETDCPAQNKMSTALIVLSKKDLQKRRIRQIRFSSGFVADYYNISASEESLSLFPQSMVIFKAANLTGPKKDRLTLGFNGSGQIALHIPMAKKTDDIKPQLLKFAQMRALTPVADMPVTYSANGGATYYFNDDSGHILGTIGEEGYAPLGKVTVGRPYDGPHGRTLTPVPLQVYVTRPGTTL